MDSSFTPYVRKFGDWHEWHEIKMITPVVVGIKKQNCESRKEIIINALRSWRYFAVCFGLHPTPILSLMR
jgi:hypothetical protein